MIDAAPLVPLLLLPTAAFAANTARQYRLNDESRAPLDEAAYFEVLDSPIGGIGAKGLFATKSIAAGTFLFDYLGEVLDEASFFDRYPDADGRYIAGITDDLYIDGGDAAKSNVARWMNHAPPAKANVEWKKQRLGPKKAMHFYALRDIAVGDEVCFDYGEEYWEVLGETPL